MTIGEKIKRLRKERGLTQEELGNLIGVQKAAINKYETGIVINLKRDVISKLAKALDVNPVWLMDENDGWPPVPSTRTLIARAFEEDKLYKETASPKTPEARAVSFGMDSLPEEQRKLILNMVKAMYPGNFNTKGTNDDEA